MYLSFRALCLIQADLVVVGHMCDGVNGHKYAYTFKHKNTLRLLARGDYVFASPDMAEEAGRALCRTLGNIQLEALRDALKATATATSGVLVGRNVWPLIDAALFPAKA